MTTFQSPPAPPVPGPARPAPPPPQPGARSVGGGVACLIAGVILLVTGLIMGGTGIALQALGDTWRRNGYVTPLSVQLTSPSYAIATERLDMEEPGQSWPEDVERLGSVRVSVTGTAGQPVFIGIAPADQVSAYLAGVRHATLIEIDDPTTTQYTEHPGAAPVRNPAAETFWTTSATGTGTQHLEWPQRTGTWMVVVMNADASAGVDVRADIGATIPLQERVTVGVLVGSVPVTVLGVLLLVLGVHLLRRPSAIPPTP
jgi:hypothetical protein